MSVIQHQLKTLGYPSLAATNGQEAINLIKSEISNNDSSFTNNQYNATTDSRISLILMDCAMVNKKSDFLFIN
jgi:CheY-like chemotaxis protein